eukprot:gene19679-biopygen39979
MIDVAQLDLSRLTDLRDAACRDRLHLKAGYDTADGELLYKGAIPPAALLDHDPALARCEGLAADWGCPAARRKPSAALRRAFVARLPAATRRAVRGWALAAPPPAAYGSELGPNVPVDDSCRDKQGDAWLFRDGRQWRIVFTDGAASNNEDPRFRRAGYGVYFGPDCGWNVSRPLLNYVVADSSTGLEQGNNAAELEAVIEAFEMLLSADKLQPVEIRTDSQWVCSGYAKLDHWHDLDWRAKRNARSRIDFYERWRRLRELREIWDAAKIHIVWVKGHVAHEATALRHATPFNRAGNAAADAAATAGAAMHA